MAFDYLLEIVSHHTNTFLIVIIINKSYHAESLPTFCQRVGFLKRNNAFCYIINMTTAKCAFFSLRTLDETFSFIKHNLLLLFLRIKKSHEI